MTVLALTIAFAGGLFCGSLITYGAFGRRMRG